MENSPSPRQRRIHELRDAARPDLDIPDPLYKVEFDELKSLADRACEEAAERVFTPALYWVCGVSGPHGIREVAFRLKVLRKIAATLPTMGPSSWSNLDAMNRQRGENVTREDVAKQVDAAIAFCERWQPLAAKLDAAKKTAIKGRKPSGKPRVTPERTYENTGTCACCRRNVKMERGKIVMHGFTIRPGFRAGRCVGVGHDPIEVSDEGLRALLRFYTNQLQQAKDAAHAVRASGKDLHDAKAAANLRNLDADARWFAARIPEVETLIKAWTPKPLPTA